jgi:hypothetical protein
VTISAQDLMSTNPNDWLIWVGDDEFNGMGTLACEIQPPMQQSWLMNGGFTVQNVANCVSVTIGLTCQP